MPVFLDGKCTCYCARATSDNITPRYKNSPGAMDIFNAGYLTGEGKGGALFIAEAILDALSIEACGYRAVALCGAANVGKFLSLCAAHPAAAAGYTLVAAGDMDAAGERMNRSLKEGLEAVSYTHLDVYKRQRVARSRWFVGSSSKRTLPSSYIMIANFRRAFSPPESISTRL